MLRTELNKYFDEQTGLHRWAEYNTLMPHGVSSHDTKSEWLISRHSIPVDEHSGFNEAKAKSLSFQVDIKNINYIDYQEKDHIDLENSSDGTRSGCTTWYLQDGSKIPEIVTYPK